MNPKTEPKPKTLSQLYPEKWIKAADLNGRPITLTIQSADAESLYSQQTREYHWKVV